MPPKARTSLGTAARALEEDPGQASVDFDKSPEFMSRFQRHLPPGFALRGIRSRIWRRLQLGNATPSPTQATESLETAARAPERDPRLAIYDFHEDAESIRLNPSQADSLFSGPDEEDMRNKLQKMLDNFKGDTKKLLRRKRRRSSMYIRATVKKMQEKIEHDLKIQKEQREKICEEYSEAFSTLAVMWNRDLQKVHEEREKLIGMIQQLQEAAEQSQILHNQHMKAFRELFEEFLKKLEELEDDHENVLAHERNELRKEMDILQTKLMTETGEEAGTRRSLLSLLLS